MVLVEEQEVCEAKTRIVRGIEICNTAANSWQ